VESITVPLREVDRAVLDGQEEGFFRVHLRAGSDHILGATLVAEHAGEMISEVALAITAGAGLSKIGSTIHPYPTQAEVFRKAADTWRRTQLTPPARRALGWFFRTFE
jgi:pyruvate/2-oxoglutarate dehydrogenase complex dihydrolipoamide dehydrogenase (E3) component